MSSPNNQGWGVQTMKIIDAMQDVPGMSQKEIEEFLASGKLPLRLGTVDSRGEANIHPVWFVYEDGHLYIFTEKGTRKVRNIDRTKRVYFSVDTDHPPHRGVKGKATASFLGDVSKSQQIGAKVIRKYMGDTNNPFATSLNEEIKSGDEIIIELTPLYYSTWDYG